MKRVFLIVLDSVGCGEAPDAADFGDAGSNTLRSCYKTGLLRIPHLQRIGIGGIEGVSFLGKTDRPQGAYTRLREVSRAKDTTAGHWELAGVVSPHPFPTYPNGFPDEVIRAFTQATGCGVLCNRPYSGTEVIRDYGAEHLRTKDLIIYTSADSVFQIAAHEDLYPIEKLYEICRTARRILQGEHAVGRVIARPFVGNPVSGFTRTANRRDFSLEPPAETLPDAVRSAGLDSISVGKIYDIFAGRGFTDFILTHGNAEGMQAVTEVAKRSFHGLCFVNLVDFDMLYGHRNNAAGYADALNEFDRWLGGFLPQLGKEDVLLITADHGCDPGDVSTDHTREYVPLLIVGEGIPKGALPAGVFSDVGAIVRALLGLPAPAVGNDLFRRKGADK